MHDMPHDRIALVDMDGTLCDYNKKLAEDMARLKSPEEPVFKGEIRDAPEYLRNRADLIRTSIEWWRDLPRLQLGWDVKQAAEEVGYDIAILTQGPSHNALAWAGKKMWIDDNMGHDTIVHITRDKGHAYGKVLVDDWPAYAERWLTWRKRAVVIMPVSEFNKDYQNERVIMYDGSNLDVVRNALHLRLTYPDGLNQLLRHEKESRKRILH